MRNRLLSLYCWYIVIQGMMQDGRPIREIAQVISKAVV